MSMPRNQFTAALGRLESMAKGGSTQLHHTGSDSVPGQHAGTSTSDYQDEHTDGIDENGTDYNGVKKALAAKVEKCQALTPAEVALVKGQDPRQLIAAKIQKGQRLTPAERWALNKGADKPSSPGTPGEAKDANSVPDSHAGEAEPDEIEPDAKKSLQQAAAGKPNLSKGLEMSPILAEFASAMGEGLSSVSADVARQVQKSLQPFMQRLANLEKSMNEQGEFNKSFAETLVGIGQHVAGGTEVGAAAAQQPAHAPKSHLRAIQGGQQPQGQPGVQPVQKSFGPGGLEMGGDQMNKSQVIGVMSDLVQKGKLNSLDVIKYESTGEISPQVQQIVMTHAQQMGQGVG